jgi:molecular chaperone DnaK (HSP70)
MIVGIDLGTTFSAVAAVQDGTPWILPQGEERIMPSIVSLTPEGACSSAPLLGTNTPSTLNEPSVPSNAGWVPMSA